MNKEEATQELQNQARHHCGEIECYKDGCEKSVGLSKAINIVSCIDEPQKVVIPNFVAEHVEHLKSMGSPMCDIFNQNFIDDDRITKWLLKSPDANDRLGRAWLDGYEIEPEKLYTVEIPNPHTTGNHLMVLVMNAFNQVIIRKEYNDEWKKDKSYQLTEEEIKKDFAWAWDAGFAKEVE